MAKEKTFRLNKIIRMVADKQPYYKEFAIMNDFEKFQDRFKTEDLGSSPFEEEWEYNHFLRYEEFSEHTIKRLQSKYSILQSDLEPTIKGLEFRAMAVETGTYGAAKAMVWKRNLIYELTNKDILGIATEERKEFSNMYNQNEVVANIRGRKITLAEFAYIIEKMDIEDIDRISRIDIVPDFRAYGSDQPAVKGANLQNISLAIDTLVNQYNEGSTLLKFVTPNEAYKKMVDQFMSNRAKKELGARYTSMSDEDKELEMFYQRDKKDKLWSFDIKGNPYIKGVPRWKYPSIIEYSRKRYKEEGLL